MSEQTFRHTYNCAVDAYWRCVFDEEYNRRLYQDLKFREFRKISQDETPTSISRKLFMTPAASDLPGPVAKVIGDLSWTEEGTWDKKTGHYRYKIITASKPDRTKIEGEIWCEPRGDKRMERFARLSVDVSIMMIGGIVEKRIFEDSKKSFEAAVKFTDAFVAEKGW